MLNLRYELLIILKNKHGFHCIFNSDNKFCMYTYYVLCIINKAAMFQHKQKHSSEPLLLLISTSSIYQPLVLSGNQILKMLRNKGTFMRGMFTKRAN